MSKVQARGALPAGQCAQQAQLPQLPEAVLISILQYVPTVDRLARCALVCKAWASAVASTTCKLGEDSDLPLSIVGPEHCRSIQSWLQQWGPQVASIHLEYTQATFEEGSVSGRLLLPCSKLTRLESLSLVDVCWMFHTQQGSISTRSTRWGSTYQLLPASHSSSRSSRSNCAAQTAAAGASGPGVFLPLLRDLRLCNCWVSLDSFQQLSKLTALTQLHLSKVQACTGRWHSCGAAQYTAAFTGILQQLQGLERLLLGHRFCMQQPGTALAPLSTMERLQWLTLSADTCDSEGLKHLPTSLTYLSLTGSIMAGEADLAVMPDSLPQLSLLQELDLNSVRLDPGVFGKLSALRRLTLSSVDLGQPEVDDWDVEDEEVYERNKAFLMALGQLTQLEGLWLTGMQLVDVDDPHPFTALTASSQLTALYVRDSAGMPLPKEALQHMLAHDRQLPNLKALHLGTAHPAYYADEPCVDVLDVGRIASCLPGLEVLSLCNVVAGLAAVRELTQLMPRLGLRVLCVGGDVFDDAAAAVVAQLTSLKTLYWMDSSVTVVGLQQLTALKGLESLVLTDCFELHEDVMNMTGANGEEALALITSKEAAAAGTPDVWLQLQQQCEKDPRYRRARMQAEQTAAARGKPGGGKKSGTASVGKRR